MATSDASVAAAADDDDDNVALCQPASQYADYTVRHCVVFPL